MSGSITLRLTIHNLLSKQGYPASGVLERDGEMLGFVNGFASPSSVEFKPKSRIGRPRTLEKHIGVWLATQAVLAPGKRSKADARRRVATNFEYKGERSEHLEKEIVRVMKRRDVKQEIARARLILHVVEDANSHVSMAIEDHDLSLSDDCTALTGSFKGWVYKSCDKQAQYARFTMSLNFKSPVQKSDIEDAFCIDGDIQKGGA